MAERLRLPKGLVERLDLDAAIASEVALPRQLIPSRVLERAVALRIKEATDYVSGVLAEGLSLEPADQIHALKPGGGVRPLSILTFPQRIALQALAQVIDAEVSTAKRTFDSWEAFQHAPLDESTGQYIASSDVSAFYFYVDHELLRSELIGQTGDADLADTLVQLLHGVMGRRFGLPQLYRPCDIFSELVIDIAERRMLRAGYQTWRYNDDFRIAAATRAEAKDGLERLHLEVQRLGLSLNDEKTYIERRSTYKQWADATDRAWSAIEDAVDFDFRTFDIYSDEEELEEEDETEEETETRLLAAAEGALAFWNAQTQRKDRGPRAPASVYRRLLTRAFSILIRFSSEQGMDTASRILNVEPHLAPMIMRYMTAISRRDARLARTTIQSWLASKLVYLNAWQKAWLITPLGHTGQPSPRTTQHLMGLLDSRYPDVLRARSALVLSMNQGVEPSIVTDLYQTISPSSQPDLVAAGAYLLPSSSPVLQALQREGPIHRWIVEWVNEGAP